MNSTSMKYRTMSSILIYVYLESLGLGGYGGSKKKDEKIIASFLKNFMKTIKPKIQEAKKPQPHENEENMPKHIIIKLLKISDKYLKYPGWGVVILYTKEQKQRLQLISSLETMQAKTQLNIYHIQFHA